MTDKTKEQLADEAVEAFNNLSARFQEVSGRPATKEELEVIRERVMLLYFGFYEREEVVQDGEDKQE
mgnify:CR=1 FL=1|jgi:hypothetical protein